MDNDNITSGQWFENVGIQLETEEDVVMADKEIEKEIVDLVSMLKDPAYDFLRESVISKLEHIAQVQATKHVDENFYLAEQAFKEFVRLPSEVDLKFIQFIEPFLENKLDPTQAFYRREKDQIFLKLTGPAPVTRQQRLMYFEFSTEEFLLIERLTFEEDPKKILEAFKFFANHEPHVRPIVALTLKLLIQPNLEVFDYAPEEERYLCKRFEDLAGQARDGHDLTEAVNLPERWKDEKTPPPPIEDQILSLSNGQVAWCNQFTRVQLDALQNHADALQKQLVSNSLAKHLFSEEEEEDGFKF